ncbi:hypothetical protein N8D77_13480 [Curtobacterium flaccumfaciens]|uniref:hypothetical protein n=1 Tax=Curtobacterium flaccumfaciens TaxID=2035 RepID=UPI0021C95994|nr:hypothetical protein [Curtobacterium flaccumfaciens]UXN21154.1 hypothetical protein N8D77_13480 [Curtobacterium flaccumfaciens pv. flaccumfaciens]
MPLLLLSLSARFDAVNWQTLAMMTFTKSTGAAILRRHLDVRRPDDGWTFTLLDGTPLTDPTDLTDPTNPLVEAATQVMDVLTELRSAGRGGEAAGPVDV